MCGIVGYIGNRKTTDVLIKGLKALEYRGYDSAGVALTDGETLKIIKCAGKVSLLEEKLKKEKEFLSNYGIAHTRWATTGTPNDINAHPHNVGKVTLVHNGIIENAIYLKEELKNSGYSFKSDTDSEVIAALIDNFLKNNKPLEAIQLATSKLIGSYSLVIMINSSKDKLYVTRCDSPLIIGKGDNEFIVASDIPAILDYTNKYILLNKKEIGVITKEKIEIYNNNLEIVEEELKTTNSKITDKSKLGYDHYMLKEIIEEPVVIENAIKYYLDNLEDFDLSTYEEIHIVACGSAMYAGMIGKELLINYANIPTLVEVASEYRYKKYIYNRKTLVILISQSGETADTIAAMNKAKDNNIDTLAIVNTEDSTIARESLKTLFIKAGVEIAVATTKAYLLQVLLLSFLAYKTGVTKKIINKEKELTIIDTYNLLPRLLKEVIDKRDIYQEIAKRIYTAKDVFFIGRGIDYAIALEGSLKLKEISYIHSDAFAAGELKHGTISLIEKGIPVISIVTNKELKDKSYSNTLETISRESLPIIVTTKELDTFNDLKIVVPTIDDFLQPILVVPTLQLLAYEVAVLKNYDIDQPRNLAKSVTVE